MGENYLSKRSDFDILFTDLNSPCYCDNDDSDDIFKIELTKEKLQEVEGDINPNIYDSSFVDQRVILSENIYDNVE